MVWIDLSVVLLSIIMPSVVESRVEWSVKTKPSVIGENFTLLCQIDGSRSNKFSVIWEKGDQLIAIDDSLADDGGKYSVKNESDGHALTITDLSFNDFGSKYICTCGFESCSRKLDIDGNVEYQPPANTIIQQMKSNATSAKINVTFLEVLPIPKCQIVINRKNKSESLHYDDVKISEWYRVSVSLVYSRNESCSDNDEVKMTCQIGSHTQTVIEKAKEHQCSEKTTTTVPKIIHMPDATGFTTIAVIVAGTLLAGVIIFIAPIIIFTVCRSRDKSQSSRSVRYKNVNQTNTHNIEIQSGLEPTTI